SSACCARWRHPQSHIVRHARCFPTHVGRPAQENSDGGVTRGRVLRAARDTRVTTRRPSRRIGRLSGGTTVAETVSMPTRAATFVSRRSLSFLMLLAALAPACVDQPPDENNDDKKPASICVAPKGEPIVHQGGITASETWSADSVHVVDGTFGIRGGSTLTL